jgi:rubrerythrin
MERTAIVEDLNRVLRGELSAIETYRQALDKIRDEYGQDARYQQLTRMLLDHQQAASQLRTKIRELGGTESNDSGGWGTWSKTVMGAAKLLGDKSALKALKEGEESGISDYRSLLQDRTPPEEIRKLITPIMTQEQEHVYQLDRLIEAA